MKRPASSGQHWRIARHRERTGERPDRLGKRVGTRDQLQAVGLQQRLLGGVVVVRVIHQEVEDLLDHLVPVIEDALELGA